MAFYQAFGDSDAEVDDISAAVKAERRALEQSIRESPFSAPRYRELASFYVRIHRKERAQVIDEAAAALEGKSAPTSASLISTLGEEEWSQSLHPALNDCAAEIGALIGPAVCETVARQTGTFPVRGPFTMDGSDNAWAMADALLAAVRVMGIRSGAIYLWKESETDPVAAIPTWPPSLCVSKPLLKNSYPAACLRFFAGRALTSLRPELQMYLLVAPEIIGHVLHELDKLLHGDGHATGMIRDVVQRVSGKSAERLTWLLERLGDDGIPLTDLCLAARHTANRMGLMVAGNVGEALRAMDMAHASPGEKSTLLGFAISDAYFRMRVR